MIVLKSTISAPPGARLEAKHGERSVKVKSHGSHKEEDGSFTIKGRLIDANRELRDVLAGLDPIHDTTQVLVEVVTPPAGSAAGSPGP